jgi:hypothetical protein
MRIVKVKVEGVDLDFEKAKSIADLLTNGVPVAWSDGKRHYPEVCCVCGDKPGWMAYGETRGNVRVEVNEFVFYYRVE